MAAMKVADSSRIGSAAGFVTEVSERRTASAPCVYSLKCVSVEDYNVRLLLDHHLLIWLLFSLVSGPIHFSRTYHREKGTAIEGD